jgi:hypothetical protein
VVVVATYSRQYGTIAIAIATATAIACTRTPEGNKNGQFLSRKGTMGMARYIAPKLKGNPEELARLKARGAVKKSLIYSFFSFPPKRTKNNLVTMEKNVVVVCSCFRIVRRVLRQQWFRSISHSIGFGHLLPRERNPTAKFVLV